MAAATLQSPVQVQNDSVFASVFAPKNFTTPTPEATPDIGALASSGQPFGGFVVSSSPADSAVKLARAWSTATRFFTLSTGFDGKVKRLSESREVVQGLSILLDGAQSQRELSSWYMHEIGTHFRSHVLPKLGFWHEPIAKAKAMDALSASSTVLQNAQMQYLGGIEMHCEHARGANTAEYSFYSKLKQDFHILVLHSLPRSRVQKTLASVLYQTLKDSLDQDSNPEACLKRRQCTCTINVNMDMLRGLADIGFGGDMGERALAHAVHKLIERPMIERRCLEVDWTGGNSVVQNLRTWITQELDPAIAKAVNAISGSADIVLPRLQLAAFAVNSLGKLRIDAMFDYVKAWPDSQGAILDVREYLNVNGTPEKAQLCSTFTNQLQQRILHAGASTGEILSVYINAIGVFKTLDPRGVLLEKVAVPIRTYLRSREDTVSIIAASFLADVDRAHPVIDHDLEKVCVDLAIEVADSKIGPEVHKALNYDDMEWVPDPIDAGPDFKASKTDDIVAYMLGLFEHDDFVQAFHIALGAHLLRVNRSELIRETRLIELLKSRLDSAKIQSFEVMLKDIRESEAISRRIHPRHQPGMPTPKEIQSSIPSEGISLNALYSIFESRMDRKQFTAAVQLVARHDQRKDLLFPKRTRLPAEAMDPSSQPSPRSISPNQFQVKLISDFFWPARRSTKPRVPSQLEHMPVSFASAFESLTGGQRRLEWDHASGYTKLRLRMEDRLFADDEVPFHMVSVIDAFALERRDIVTPTSRLEPSADCAPVQYDPDVGLSVSDLTDALQLPEDLILDAISYWTGHRILYQLSPGRYAVLERLDMAVEPVVQEAAEAPLSAEDAVLRENAPTYRAFIISMLQNTPVNQVEGDSGITNFMRMMVPDFTYGDKEVHWLLRGMLTDGEVKMEGDVWSVL